MAAAASNRLERAADALRRLGITPAIGALLLLGLVLRLAWVAIHPVELRSDFIEYQQHAATLAEHGVYGPDADHHGVFWPPGWPSVLAGLYWLIGPEPRLGAAFGTVLGWLGMVAVAVAAARLLRPRFATLAVGAMALYPTAIGFSPVLATEHLATLLFSVIAVLIAFAKPTPKVALTAGLLCGALVLTRAEYGTAMTLVLALWIARSLPLRRVAVVGATAAAGVLLVVGPWTLRNVDVYGDAIPTSTNGGVTFYLSTLDVHYTDPEPVLFEQVQALEDPQARDRRWWRLGLENVADDPLGYAALIAQRPIPQYTDEARVLDFANVDAKAVTTVATIYWIPLVLLALAGTVLIFIERRRIDRAWIWLAGSVLAVTAIKLLFFAAGRDRLPLSYVLIAIAAFAAQALVDRARSPNAERPGAARPT